MKRAGESRLRFKRAYKGLSKKQQQVARHNRFLTRMWKVPQAERLSHRTCVACLEDFLTGGSKSPMIIMACDHPIHMECFIRHAEAYMDLQGIPLVTQASDDDFMEVLKRRYWIYTCGAPCPACRTALPMRHFAVFHEGW